MDDTAKVLLAKSLEDSQIETKQMKKIRDELKQFTLSETPYTKFVIPNHFTQTTENMQFSLLSLWLFKVQPVISDFSHLQSLWVFILQHYKTRGRVFPNVGVNDAEYKKIIFVFIFYFNVLIFKDSYSIDLI